MTGTILHLTWSTKVITISQGDPSVECQRHKVNNQKEVEVGFSTYSFFNCCSYSILDGVGEVLRCTGGGGGVAPRVFHQHNGIFIETRNWNWMTHSIVLQKFGNIILELIRVEGVIHILCNHF